MSISDNERPKFYEGEYLGAEDLTASVDYGRTQQARHALGAHTWGIAMGLQLKETPSTAGGEDVDVSVQPGYAWDGFGRPIVVLAPYKIPADKFKSFVYDRSIDDPAGRLIEIWIRYDETSYQSPKTGFEVCDVKDQYARVKETFQIEIGERPNHPDRHDPIVVAGRTTDAEKVLQAFNPASPLIYDESVPYQTFAGQDGKERWLLPLGYVRWQPNQDPNQPGRFVKRTKDDLESSRKFRHYIGVVAERIEGARGFIRMRKRIKDPALTVWSDDLVWVEGSLRVDKDARLFGGKLDFRDNVGDDEGTPLAIRRIEHNDQKGKDLQLIIGEKQDGLNRLSIGPLKKDGSLDEKVVVTDAGNVGIGTDKPGEALEIGNSGNLLLKASGDDPGDIIFQDSNSIQKGKIWSNPSPGAGLFLSSGDSNPDISIDSKGNVGIGTTTPSVKLEVKGTVKADYFIGDGSKLTGIVGQWLYGTGGSIYYNGGNVGIGTASPSTKLEVYTSDSGHGDVLVRGRLMSISGQHGGGLYVDSEACFVGSNFKGGIGFNTNNQWQLVVQQDGNVGIGTDNPSEKLVVKADKYGFLHIDTNGTIQVGTWIGQNAGWLGTKSDHNLNFFTNNGDARVTIDTKGNVGIGTDAPDYMLTVSDTIHSIKPLAPSKVDVQSSPSPVFLNPKQSDSKLLLYTNEKTENPKGEGDWAGIGVDSDGSVWIRTGTKGQGHIAKFNPDGSFTLDAITPWIP